MEVQKVNRQASEQQKKQANGELLYVITHLVLIPINFTFYVTIFVLMIDKTIILMPILLSIITLFCHCLCAFAIMDRFEAT